MDTPATIRVDFHRGGGVEVTQSDYRPLGLHIRVLSDDVIARTVAETVYGLMLVQLREERKYVRVV